MPDSTISAAVREAINGDIDLPADEVIRMLRERGSAAGDESIRGAVYNVKSELRKAAKKAGVKPAAKPASKPVAKASPKPAAKRAPAVARETREPAAVPVESPPAAQTADLRAVLASVALVTEVLGACGGVDGARKVAEAVRGCGGVDPFLLHLDLIAQVRGAAG